MRLPSSRSFSLAAPFHFWSTEMSTVFLSLLCFSRVLQFSLYHWTLYWQQMGSVYPWTCRIVLNGNQSFQVWDPTLKSQFKWQMSHFPQWFQYTTKTSVQVLSWHPKLLFYPAEMPGTLTTSYIWMLYSLPLFFICLALTLPFRPRSNATSTVKPSLTLEGSELW